jgi:nucleoside-diphosphate-sugar epimerase
VKKIIITGAGGFIGSELTGKYADNGYEVIAISSMFNPSFPVHPNIKKYCIEINEEEKLLEILHEDEYEAFYHLAWRGVNGPEKAIPQIQLGNMKLAMGCAEVAYKIGCKKFLCSGTIAERGVESLSSIKKTSGGMLYGVAKHCTHLLLEAYCKNVGLDFVWMQFSNIYGPQNKTGNLVSYTLGEITNGKEAIFGPAKQPYDFIYVDDLIEAVYRIGIRKTSKNAYLIGSGTPKILKEYLTDIGTQYGRPDLIKVGIRPDDGIVYSMDMFDIKDLVEDIGNYVQTDFGSGIRNTIDGY